MTTLRRFRIPVLAGSIVFTVALSYAYGFIGNSQMRIRREHGIHLPASASAIRCRGDAWLCFLDRGAASTFEITANDLLALLSQLNVQSSTRGVQESIFPGNPQYQVRASWISG